jgi:Protein of unknown function (DUF3540)
MSATRRAVYASMSAIVGQVGYVREVREDATLTLTDGRCVRVAASCLLQPQCGDRVVLIEIAGGEAFVHAILERDAAQPANLQIPGAQRVTLSARNLMLAASDSLQMCSLRDIEIAAAAGVVGITAPHVTVTAVESIIQSAKQYLASIGTYALQVSGLIRMHGQQAIVTAQQDIKIDAERISVG